MQSLNIGGASRRRADGSVDGLLLVCVCCYRHRQCCVIHSHAIAKLIELN